MDSPTNPEKAKVLKQAQALFREGQWDKALVEYEKLQAMDKSDLDVLVILGDIHAKKRSYQSAYETYDKAVAEFSTLRQTDNAILIYKKIIKWEVAKLPVELRMNMNIFQSYLEIDEELKNGRTDVAIGMLGKLLKMRPKDHLAHAMLKDLGDMIEKTKPTLQRYQILADAFSKHGLLDKAQELYKKISEMDPKNRSARTSLAKIFQKQGSDGEAKKAYLHLAELALTENDLDGAFEFVQKAIELKSVEAGYILGLIRFKEKKWTDAKNEFENLLRIKVNHVGALTHLGQVNAALGHPEKATENFRKALAIDKNNAQAQEAWVEFCIQNKDKDTAIPYLTALLDKAVADNHAERTAKFSRMMIQLNPALEFPRVKLIEALQTLGDLQGAADTSRALSVIYEQQGQLNEAAQCLEKALQWVPTDEALIKALAEVQQKNPQPQAPLQSVPTAEFIELKQEVLGNPDPVDVIRFDEITAEEELETQAPSPEPLPAEPSNSNLPEPQPVAPVAQPSNGLESQMNTAALCVQQGLLKAAIDIYQQILEVHPHLTDVRKKLNEVNASYLQKWVESKK
jgi:tetratricopeptide (TPR) repeat protein